MEKDRIFFSQNIDNFEINFDSNSDIKEVMIHDSNVDCKFENIIYKEIKSTKEVVVGYTTNDKFNARTIRGGIEKVWIMKQDQDSNGTLIKKFDKEAGEVEITEIKPYISENGKLVYIYENTKTIDGIKPEYGYNKEKHIIEKRVALEMINNLIKEDEIKDKISSINNLVDMAVEKTNNSKVKYKGK